MGRDGPSARAGHNRIRAGRAEPGQSVVEFALIVPLLAIIVLVSVEFGFMIANKVTLVHAAADGAREGARRDTPSNQTEAQQQTLAYLNDLRHCTNATANATYTAVNLNGGNADLVTVSVSCQYQPLTPVGSVTALIGGANPTLSATTTMRVQGCNPSSPSCS